MTHDNCTGLHCPKNQCTICFALAHGEVCIDVDKDDYGVCEEHYKLAKEDDDEKQQLGG